MIERRDGLKILTIQKAIHALSVLAIDSENCELVTTAYVGRILNVLSDDLDNELEHYLKVYFQKTLNELPKNE